MKATIKNLFSVSASDTEYFNDDQDKFELVSCPRNGKHCSKTLSVLNKDYQEAQLYRRDKIYEKSISLLKRAYNTTHDLTEPTCAKCADLFRSSISESLELIKKEQYKRSVGLFKYKLHPSGYLKLQGAVKEG